MATYALIHGAGDVGWYWHLVERELRARGHDTVAPDLPIENADATLEDHAQVVIDAIGDRGEVIVVGQFGRRLRRADRRRARGGGRLILVAGMIPQPGETAGEMWADDRLADAAQRGPEAIWRSSTTTSTRRSPPRRSRENDREADADEPWPLAAWPDVPTHFILCRDDRFFAADWLRGVVRDRLGIEPDELDSGHTPALSHPTELVELMESYR